MDLQLTNKVAIVTGGSKGIGFETALLLAKEGADVAVFARGLERLSQVAEWIEKETGKKIYYAAKDVTKKEDCESLVAETAERFGGVDILINNAGTSAANPFEAVDDDLWRQDLDLKLFAAINCSRAAIPFMRKRQGGSIVNVTASGAKTPSASSLPTSVSRSAGMALTKAMSNDLGKDHIRVNTVGIGLVRSDQIEKRWKQVHPDLTWEEFSVLPSHNIPLGRIGDTSEAARVIVFLASDAASYVTGTSVNIDGGKAAAL